MQDLGVSHALLALNADNVTGNVTAGQSLLQMLNNLTNSGLITWVFGFLFFLFIVTALFIFVPVYLDSRWAIQTNRELIKKIDDLNSTQFSEQTKKDLLEKIISGAQEPSGIRGTTRRTIAFTVLLVIGLTVFTIVLISADGQLINTALTSLTSVFATIIGFYFGGAQASQSSTSATKNAQASTKPATTPAVPDISGIHPDNGVTGNTINGVKIFGSNFPAGSQISLQMSGQTTIPAKNIVVTSPKIITCDIDLTAGTPIKGKWDVVLTAGGSNSILKSSFEIK